MKIVFGQSAASKVEQLVVEWDSSRSINPHCLLVGDSGSGKTYRLLKMIDDIASGSPCPRIHLMDGHGDILVPGASSVKFSQSCDYGFNPLELNPNRDFGGVRKRIETFIETVNRSRKLGVRQEAVLRNLLTDLYSAGGFKTDDPDSWTVRQETPPAHSQGGRIYLDVPFEEKERAKAAGALWDALAKAWYVPAGKHDGPLLRWGPKQFGKRYPTLLDAVRYTNKRVNAMFFGTNTPIMNYLEDVNRLSSNLMAKEMTAVKRGEDLEGKEKLEKDLASAKTKFIGAVKDYVSEIRTGRELEEYKKYDSKEVLKAVLDRLEGLNALGIFRNTPPPFDAHAAVWHYDISPLRDAEKRLFVDFRLEAIFARAVERGPTQHIRDVIVVDEADIYTSDEPDHILNKLIKEARKFGVALILASQAPDHFSDNMLSGVAVRVVLGIDKFHWPFLQRRLGMEERDLGFVVPRRRAIVQIKNSGEVQSRCHWVNLKQ